MSPNIAVALTCTTSAPVYLAACFPAERIAPRHRSALLRPLWLSLVPHHDSICWVAGGSLGFTV